MAVARHALTRRSKGQRSSSRLRKPSRSRGCYNAVVAVVLLLLPAWDCLSRGFTASAERIGGTFTATFVVKWLNPNALGRAVNPQLGRRYAMVVGAVCGAPELPEEADDAVVRRRGLRQAASTALQVRPDHRGRMRHSPLPRSVPHLRDRSQLTRQYEHLTGSLYLCIRAATPCFRWRTCIRFHYKITGLYRFVLKNPK